MPERIRIPKLLSPAGSFDALCAAISAGADEVYFGAKGHNARSFAKNFSDDEFFDAIKLCRMSGVQSNITVNTLAFDKEINDVLELVYSAACHGADAFIVQDMGIAAEIKRQMPEVILHASTQCACHNKDGALKLFEAGFSRIVLARELSFDDICEISRNVPYETEIFAHGALCVSHSGQCLFSSVVGGRSGNRGACAQPCRMEYTLECGGCSAKGYPLSTKDMALATHIKELIKTGTASLKLEGRMKSAEYVYGVTKIYKTLLTEQRNATEEEMLTLRSLFSRGGFTDGYFTKSFLSSNKSMYGIRSEKEKETTRKTEKEMSVPDVKIPVSAVCSFEEGKVPSLSLLCREHVVSVSGKEPLSPAKNAGADFDSVAKNLTKFGNTHFELGREDISMSLGQNVFVPAGVVNEMRREAAELLEKNMTQDICVKRARIGFAPSRRESAGNQPSVRLYFATTHSFDKKIKDYENIESVVFPLDVFGRESENMREVTARYKTGILFPRVLFCGEKNKALELLCKAKELGASFCEVSNIGHIEIAETAGLDVYGGIGLNITNSLSAEYYSDICKLRSLVISPEAKFGAVRDIARKDGVKYCFYARGRLPLMVLESCIVRGAKDGMCKKNKSVCAHLGDRMNFDFPVFASPRLDREFPCRNIIYNSVITDLRTKKELYNSGIDVICISAEHDGFPV